MSALRSLVFTLLLEEPEFGRLTSDDGSRIVTDAVERVEKDQAADPGMTTATSMRNYVRDVTGNGTTEPGVWQRYVDVLKAQDERAAR